MHPVAGNRFFKKVHHDLFVVVAKLNFTDLLLRITTGMAGENRPVNMMCPREKSGLSVNTAMKGNAMKCVKCGKEINMNNHFYVPLKNRKEGLRYCISCAREDKIVTLV